MKVLPKLHIVTGKGGVGKTTMACALAHSYAAAGQKVLLVEINGGDRTAQALQTEPVGYTMREVLPKLWLLDCTPEASLREYVLLTIKVQAIYRAIFEGRVVSSFLRLLPALGELTMLGKIWYEWVQTDKAGRPRFDAIVVDAPATGHARALLLAPTAVKASVPKGPMRENAERIEAMLHAKEAQLEIVTLAEDMPVTEAEELIQFAGQHGYKNVRLLLNQVPVPLGAASAAWVTQLASAAGPLHQAGRSLARRDARATQGLETLARLPAALPQVRIPALPRTLQPLELTRRIASQLQGGGQGPQDAAAPAREGAA